MEEKDINKVYENIGKSFLNLFESDKDDTTRIKFRKQGQWYYIPRASFIAIKQLVKVRDFLKDNEHRMFLDCGCGLGNVLLMAWSAGFIPHGIEINPDYIKKAKTLIPDLSHRIEQKSILTFTKYSDFDVIYYYQPFSDAKKQLRFEQKVIKEMKKGAILIANRVDFRYSEYFDKLTAKRTKLFSKLKCLEFNNGIFQKQ